MGESAMIRKKLSWKTKKHLAQALSVGILSVTIAGSVYSKNMERGYEQNAGETIPSVEKQQEKEVQDNSAHLQIEHTKIESGNSSVTTRNSSNATVVKNGEKGTEVTGQDLEQVTTERRVNQSANRNNVVSSNPAEDTPNIVKSTEAASTTEMPSLVSKEIENHGEEPEKKATATLYQYPVEVGYLVDSNYDQKQDAGDILLNDVFDTTPVNPQTSETTTEQPDTEELTESVTTQLSTQQLTGEMIEENLIGQEENSDLEKNTDLANACLTEQDAEQLQIQGEEQSEQQLTDGNESTEVLDENQQDLAEQLQEEIEGQFTEETNEQEDTEDNTVIADGRYFMVSGSLREGCEAFVSDITIRPTGIDGFNQVRLGEEGEFQEEIQITEDAAEKEVLLYFSDGERVTSGVPYTYSKDLTDPFCKLATEEYHLLTDGEQNIYCTNRTELEITAEDVVADGTGIDQICYVYGDRLKYIVDDFEQAKVVVPESFFGRIIANCIDKAGNTSPIDSQFFLVDTTKPEINMQTEEICTAPYTLWGELCDGGSITSGIRSVECRVDGEIYEIADQYVEENVQLGEKLEVPVKEYFSVVLEEGVHEVEIKVTDNAGNVTIQTQTIQVTKPELVSVYMPKKFTIHIDPQQLRKREQIFSDDIILTNVSEFDVRVNVDCIEVMINDEITAEGLEKDCELYLVAPDTGEKIKLEKGTNKDVYSYILPKEKIEDMQELHFVGELSEGSDQLWEGSDIKMDIKLSFEKAEEPTD